MQNMLKTGVEWLHDQRREFMAELVTYSRGSTAIADIAATASATAYEADDGNGLIVKAEAMDFLIDAASIAALGNPKAGDRIAYGARTFEVMDLGVGMSHWRWSDRGGTVMRIHTKEVGA